MADKFEFRLNSKHRKRLMEDITEEFRDMHEYDSKSRDLEMALEKALEWKKRRREKEEELEDLEEEVQEMKDTWSL